jgi:hypothetical protein
VSGDGVVPSDLVIADGRSGHVLMVAESFGASERAAQQDVVVSTVRP